MFLHISVASSHFLLKAKGIVAVTSPSLYVDSDQFGSESTAIVYTTIIHMSNSINGFYM